MALIKCPSCGSEISDKATYCISCGALVHGDNTSQYQDKNIIKCEECGTVYSKGAGFCPKCGCPKDSMQYTESPQKVEVTNIKLKINKKKRNIFIILSCLVIIAVIAGIFYKKHLDKVSEENRKEEYDSNLAITVMTILQGASDSEEAGNLIHSVWYNSIFKESDPDTDEYTKPDGYFVDDFNDALNNLFTDDSFEYDIDSIKDNQDKVKDLMKDLKNPPSEYDEAYNAIKDLYDSYSDLTNLVINPSGSLQDFNDNFNDADTECLNDYKAIEIYIE